jgi:hypothetical protein
MASCFEIDVVLGLCQSVLFTLAPICEITSSDPEVGANTGLHR